MIHIRKVKFYKCQFSCVFLCLQRLAPEGIIIIHKFSVTSYHYYVELNGNYHGLLIDKALNGLYNNVLLGQIMISFGY